MSLMPLPSAVNSFSSEEPGVIFKTSEAVRPPGGPGSRAGSSPCATSAFKESSICKAFRPAGHHGGAEGALDRFGGVHVEPLASRAKDLLPATPRRAPV